MHTNRMYFVKIEWKLSILFEIKNIYRFRDLLFYQTIKYTRLSFFGSLGLSTTMVKVIDMQNAVGITLKYDKTLFDCSQTVLYW